ncbi:NAD(P)-dependent oxidoreductase [uncultured Nostoc sp.]|uniref:NAD(P)-dependent oxidoreductase n=1 Tax=uncultured Nostoc sp. TaxID=340711 RepID=UPI00262DAFA2|nr:SDR family oxidoreductase [uncultured Nostoc sp.]
MRILVIGATGPTGQQIVEQGLAQGHEVTALVRNPDKFEMQHNSLQIVKGDILDPASLDAVQQQDAVISSLGTKKISLESVTLLSEGTKKLLQAMERHSVKRLICITGLGAGDSKGHGGLLYDKLILPLILKRIYDDKDRQEAEIRQSNLDWVIVRPGILTNDPAKGNYRVLTDLTGVTAGKISRADVAAFVLQQLTSDRYLNQTPLICY